MHERERETAEGAVVVADPWAEGSVRAALEAARVGVWEWTLASGSFRCSPSFEAIHGLEVGGFRGTVADFARLLHADDEARVRDALERAVQEGGAFAIEYRAVWPDGSVHGVEAKGRAVADDAGSVVALVGVCTDVDARRRLERRRDAQLAVTRVLAEAETLPEAAPELLRAMCEQLEWDVGAVWQLDRTAGVLRCVDFWCAPEAPARAFEDVTGAITFEPGVGVPGRVWASGRPTWVPDVHRDLNFPRAPAAVEAGLHGGFAFPIVFAGDIVGVVEFYSRELREPDADLLALAEAVGSQLGQFIERKRAEAELRATGERMRALIDVSPIPIADISSEGLVRVWNAAAEALFGWSADEVVGLPLPIVPEDRGEEHRTIRQRTSAGQRVAGFETVRRRKDGSLLDVTLWTAPIRDASGEVTDFVEFIVDSGERKRHEQRLRFLAEASELLAESLEFEETLARVARLAVPELADWCVVDMLDERGRLKRLAVAHVDPEKTRLGWEVSDRYPPRHDDPGGPAAVVRTGQAEVGAEITDEMLVAGAHDDEHLRLLRELAPRSYVCVPLRGHHGILGAITFAFGESGRRYASESLGLAEDLARHAALAIENARLYRERSHVAKTLQESLLPRRLPEVPGLDIAARYQALGEGIDVGGDFYDVFQVADGAWVFAIGDVCGKGAEAAALTGLARHTIRVAGLREPAPGAILRTLNEAIQAESAERMTFCTVVCGLVEPREGGATVTVCCGGHPLPTVLRADGSCEEVGSPGTLIGAFDDPRLVDRTLELGGGDALILYTDGVVSGRRGADGLDEIVRSCAGLDAAGIAKRIERAALAGEVRRDDLAILVLRVV